MPYRGLTFLLQKKLIKDHSRKALTAIIEDREQIGIFLVLPYLIDMLRFPAFCRHSYFSTSLLNRKTLLPKLTIIYPFHLYTSLTLTTSFYIPLALVIFYVLAEPTHMNPPPFLNQVCQETSP